MLKTYQIIKKLLKNNIFIMKSKEFNLEIVIDHQQPDLVNVKHCTIYNSFQKTTNSTELQKFFKNAYYQANASKKYHIPWVITATFNLPKIKINQNTLVNPVNTSAVINDLKNQIITEGINIKNCETNFEAKLSLQEICDNFHIEDFNLQELLNDCLKLANNNFEKIKQQSNLVTKENQTAGNYYHIQL